jgi:tetraacyldisaccharide 4'-kinase
VVGDESVLLARRTGMPVAAGRDRAVAAQLLVDAGCDIIVSDDGLQHYALSRDCEIVVIDGDRRFGNGWLLPAGPLREKRTRLESADVVVVNGGRALLDGAFSMRLEARSAVALDGSRTRPLPAFAGLEVHAVAGIGHPERFFNTLRAHGIEVIGHALPDHTRLTPEDVDFPDTRPVLMTEKDAVKCAHAADERHWYVPVSAYFEGGESTTLLDIVSERIAGRVAPRETVDG